MADWKYDVVIVGAGPAGITAAITLAKAQIPVLVLEAGVFPGAENWSGAVYFTENLAQSDVLGEEAVRESAWERPVTKRGIHIYNGHSLVGLTYRNPDTFRHCYTVLRPTYDHYLAELAKSFGATILTETTADGLLRDDVGRIIGVHTTRGPIYANVVFLAEGDASHLVTKEGYERCKAAGSPHFLQGIAEVIELDPADIERRFDLPAGGGAALEIVLRNPSIHNRPVQLNMGGFIYTNHSSLSLGLVLPLDNLAREFSGDHNRLMEWFKSLPEIKRLTGGGRSVAYGTKIIRGGGFKELPQLVDHGLALGGACTGIGLDFPYPNFTGPATAMGRLFAQAFRQAGGDFSRERLTELYEKPLRHTHYFRNIEFLQDWPHYVEHTRVFFGRAADLACGSLHIASHPDLHAGQMLWQHAKFLRETLPPKRWGEFFRDLREQRAALGLNRIQNPKSKIQNPGQGEVSLTFSVDGQSRHLAFFHKLAPHLRGSADHLYRNDDTPLPHKLNAALRHAPLLPILPFALFSLLSSLLLPLQWLCEMIGLLLTRPSPEKYLSSFFQRTRALVRQRLNLDAVPVAQPIEEKLSLIRYFSEKTSHIKVHRPEHFEQRTEIAKSPLWHVCPAKVYEQHTDDLGQVQIVVNFENCIKCETCWRAAPADVDWTRQREQRLIFSSPTPANRKLLELLQQSRIGFQPVHPKKEDRQDACPTLQTAKLRQFCADVYRGPRYFDTARRRWLLSLLEDSGCARALAHARAGRFFWAEAELRVDGVVRRSPDRAPLPTEGLPDLDRLFPKQAIKDLEHGKPLSVEQLDFLKSLQPTPDTLRLLARKDISLALLVSGIAHAQVTARPDLAEVEWIGLNTARRHAKEFGGSDIPVATLRSIALGAGEMLLERCRQHATTRVQFPGLFKDEDNHDGIAKFGAVKKLLSEMEVEVWRLRNDSGADPREALLTLAYNAGQIIGGSAYSEDDIFSKYYRDSVIFAQLLPNTKPSAPKLAANPFTELESEIRKMAGAPTSLSGRQDLTALGTRILTHGYLPEHPLQSPPHFSYRTELDKPNPYDYGDFLTKPFDPAGWRYVPEMLHTDPELRAYHEELYRYFTDNFRDKRFDGLPYYRLVEKLHQVPLADVRDMIAHGFTRMYIPKEFGGEGLLKAHYYILCPLSMRYADPSYALTIMAHSSIGTTPILLGLYQDIPRAKADLQAFLSDHSAIQNPKSKIQNILRMLDSPAALKVKEAFTALGERVKADIGKKPMLRAIASDFLQHFMDAGRAGLRMDLTTFKSELQEALTALDSLRPRAEAVIAELDRRADAAKFYLRWISAGQISAFALTEPNAGSDSGGVQTRAELKRVEVFTDSDGSKYFLLDGQMKPILDTATFDVRQTTSHDVAQIRVEMGCASRVSSVGERTTGTAIPLDNRDGRPTEFYEYYELNGAKMWITNGHVAGVFCLYARTKEGPTGFLVNRHAEGLTVGRDEEKMGQRGSPTNELSLNAVRVPRENIIGIEGRGQVNALETLNVGRTGLCVSAAAMTAKIIEQTCAFAKERGLDKEPRVQQLIGEMTIEHYATESLAYELIGRFDHHDTKSARTESAIGKYYASEVLHRVIRAAGRIYGLEGCTQLYELEKHCRDARVLNIYEGTNEVQRFLIFRDLVDHVLPKVGQASSLSLSEDDRQDACPTLTEAKATLLRAVRRAVDAFGPQTWQHANFQPTMFKLAEIAGYIKAMDSALWRTEWLRRNTTDADAPHRQIAESACTGYLDLARQQIDRLQAEFERDFTLLKQGLYPPEIRVAMLALQDAEEKPASLRQPPAHLTTAPQHTIVVMNVVPVLSPKPRVMGGDLLETHFDFDAASWTALERAVDIVGARHAVPPRVSALAVAPRYATESLRRSLALGADDAVLLETDELPSDPHAAARLLADHIALQQMPADLVVCGDPILAAVLAGNLGFPLNSSDLPSVRSIAAGDGSRDFSIDDYFSALAKPLEIIDARQITAEPRTESRFVVPEFAVTDEPAAATPETAAELARKITGVAGGGVGGEVSYPGKITLTDKARVPTRDSAVFLATPDHMEGVDIAAACAAALGLSFHVVIAANPDESTMRALAAKLPASDVWFITSAHLPAAVLPALQSLWKDTLPSVVAAGTWANETLALFANTFPRVQARYNVASVHQPNDTLELAQPVYGGKVQRVVTVAPVTEHPLVITLAPGAALNIKAAPTSRPKVISHLPLELAPVSVASPPAAERPMTIADADVIIDVGYAIRTRESFDLVVVPLKKRLEEIGVKNVMIGGTRKVVEELKLLAPDQQIGQTGTAVNPQLIISLGVSGAPQHVDYIGERATIIAFNKDADAPLLTLNKRRARPKVVPLVGDLYELVPQFTAALKR